MKKNPDPFPKNSGSGGFGSTGDLGSLSPRSSRGSRIFKPRIDIRNCFAYIGSCMKEVRCLLSLSYSRLCAGGAST